MMTFICSFASLCRSLQQNRRKVLRQLIRWQFSFLRVHQGLLIPFLALMYFYTTLPSLAILSKYENLGSVSQIKMMN